jgi:hypothetical protein
LQLAAPQDSVASRISVFGTIILRYDHTMTFRCGVHRIPGPGPRAAREPGAA